MKRLPMIAVLGAVALPLGWWWLTPKGEPAGALPDQPARGLTTLGPREPWRWHAGADDRVHDELAAIRSSVIDESTRAAILARIMSLAEADPEVAVRLSALLTDAEGREEALHESVTHWLLADPVGARAWLLGEARTLPFDILRSMARNVAAIDPGLGLSMADRLPVGERASSLNDVFSAWAARDPAEAARVGEGLPSHRDRATALDAVGSLWAEEDGQAAFEWAIRYESSSARRVALESVVGAWARREPEAAALSLATTPSGDGFRQRLLDRVAEGWAEADVDEALAWVDSLSPKEEREATATTVLLQLAASNPERAADEALHMSDGEMTGLVDKVVVFWAAQNRQGATSWVRSHGLALAFE